tara:strand:+ start:6342 stop:6539 length:198 start_codon:yes stop_codon:yes gene_type:complete
MPRPTGKIQRVHPELYDWLRKIASENHTTIVKISNVVAKDHKYFYNYVKEKQNEKMPKRKFKLPY